IYTRGTTEAINLVADTLGRTVLKAGDEVIVTEMEHHSNLVPWHMACERAGARVVAAPVDDRGVLDLEAYRALFNERTKIVAFSHVSNTLGTVNPAEEMIRIAHEHGVPVMVDGAQATPHMPVDVQALDADFYCFSGHKVCGPTGIGVLYGKEAWLDQLPPYQGGGSMIRTVEVDRSTYGGLPHRFEAGTPHIAGAVGLGAAVEYLMELGMDQIEAYEHELLDYANERLSDIDGYSPVGTAPGKAAVLSFTLGNAHPLDVGTLLDQMGIAVRTGHHCTMPLMTKYGIPGTARASLAFYNTKEEIDRLADGLQVAATMLQ
ncbi:MAG: cysteine desulfurase, partial [Bacteroidota bacterium]